MKSRFNLAHVNKVLILGDDSKLQGLSFMGMYFGNGKV